MGERLAIQWVSDLMWTGNDGRNWKRRENVSKRLTAEE